MAVQTESDPRVSAQTPTEADLMGTDPMGTARTPEDLTGAALTAVETDPMGTDLVSVYMQR